MFIISNPILPVKWLGSKSGDFAEIFRLNAVYLFTNYFDVESYTISSFIVEKYCAVSDRADFGFKFFSPSRAPVSM